MKAEDGLGSNWIIELRVLGKEVDDNNGGSDNNVWIVMVIVTCIDELNGRLNMQMETDFSLMDAFSCVESEGRWKIIFLGYHGLFLKPSK